MSLGILFAFKTAVVLSGSPGAADAKPPKRAHATHKEPQNHLRLSVGPAIGSIYSAHRYELTYRSANRIAELNAVAPSSGPAFGATAMLWFRFHSRFRGLGLGLFATYAQGVEQHAVYSSDNFDYLISSTPHWLMIGLGSPDILFFRDTMAFTGGVAWVRFWSSVAAPYDETEVSSGPALRLSLRGRYRLDDSWLLSLGGATELLPNFASISIFREKPEKPLSGAFLGVTLAIEWDPPIWRRK